MAEQYISIETVLNRVLRHPLMSDLSYETAVDYAIDFMRIVGVPNMFVEKVVELNVEDYRTALPCDYYQTIQIRDMPSRRAFIYATDSFYFSNHSSAEIIPTYKIQGGIIFTNIKHTTIELAYQAIPLDEDGKPLIPDNSSFLRALELYIKKQWFTIQFDMEKIKPAILQNVQQEYAHAVGDCQSEFHRLSIDKAEALFNSLSRMILPNQHMSGFKYSNIPEHLIKH